MRTDSNLCRKELTVHWSAPNSLIRSYLQPCTNSMWGDESEAVAPIIWLYQIVDAQKEEVFFPELLITIRSYEWRWRHHVTKWLSPYCDIPVWCKFKLYYMNFRWWWSRHDIEPLSAVLALCEGIHWWILLTDNITRNWRRSTHDMNSSWTWYPSEMHDWFRCPVANQVPDHRKQSCRFMFVGLELKRSPSEIIHPLLQFCLAGTNMTELDKNPMFWWNLLRMLMGVDPSCAGEY